MSKIKSAFINLIKNVDLRMSVNIRLSLLANFAFAAFYFVCCFFYENPVWYGTFTFWYVLLFLSRLILTITQKRCGVDSKFAYSIELLVGGILGILGLQMIVVNYCSARFGIVLNIPKWMFLLNGTCIVVKFIISFIGVKKHSTKTNGFYGCMKRITRVENLLLFSMLFSKLILLYEWNDGKLINVSIIVGYIVGASVCILGIASAIIAGIKRKKQAANTKT